MTVFEDHSPGMCNATLDKPIPAPPADRLAALAARLPADIAEALALTPYQGRDRRGREAGPPRHPHPHLGLTRPMHR